jgi:3-hydroxyisobutyrate dehydrogenase-like beta-hydroxyacid dehydrogenase
MSVEEDRREDRAMDSIGFVGLGHMGGNMATRFLGAGYPVCGTAHSRDGARWLVDRGLRWLDTPREVADAADVVLTSLPDDAVVESVSSGPDGLIAGLASGMVWVDLSTISPRVSREISERVRREGHGAQMLDAPVSGSVPQVQAGTLTIMVGGPEDAYARVEPLLRVLGTPTRIGENGHGLALKLAINISLAVQMLAFSEGLLLAQRDGVDPHLAAGVMTDSPIGSPMLKARVPLVLDQPDETWFDVGMMHKDIRLALAVGKELDAPLPSAAVAEKVLERATAAGYEHHDIASIFHLLGATASASPSDSAAAAGRSPD